MRKVCEVYLVSSSASDERGVELTFPVSQYEMMDAFEQIRTKSPGDVYWQVEEFYCFDYLAPHLDESMSIFEFNSLTEQLSKLDARQEIAMEGLLDTGRRRQRSRSTSSKTPSSVARSRIPLRRRNSVRPLQGLTCRKLWSSRSSTVSGLAWRFRGRNRPMTRSPRLGRPSPVRWYSTLTTSTSISSRSLR